MTSHIVKVAEQIRPIIVEQGLDTKEIDGIIKFGEMMPDRPTHVLSMRLQRYVMTLAFEHTPPPPNKLPEWVTRVVEACKIEVPA